MEDSEAFAAFYRQTAPALRQYLARMLGRATDADDILQETYLRLLRNPPVIADPDELRRYLYRVASNLVTDRWRKRKREAAWTDSSDVVAPSFDTVEKVDMERTFEQLRPRERQLMWLAYVEGFSHRDIAAALGLAERSIKVLLSRARQRLETLVRGTTGRKP